MRTADRKLQTANCKPRTLGRGAIVKATLLVAAAMLTVGSAAHVQESSPTQNPPPVAAPVAPPAAAPAAAPAAPQAPAPQPPSARRRDISRMEGILMQAL